MTWRTRLQHGFASLVSDTPAEPARVVALDAVDVAMPPARVRNRRQAAYRPQDGAIAGTELAVKLESLTHRAFDRADEILDIELDPEEDRYPENLRALNATIKTVVGTQVKVDEHRLKARKLDVLPELLEIIATEEQKRMKVI